MKHVSLNTSANKSAEWIFVIMWIIKVKLNVIILFSFHRPAGGTLHVNDYFVTFKNSRTKKLNMIQMV